VILAHHGYGEELIVYAVAGGSGAAYAIGLVWRAKVEAFIRWLRRK
jgi:shikimate kinase